MPERIMPMRIEDPNLKKYSEKRGFNQSKPIKPAIFWTIMVLLFLLAAYFEVPS